MELLKEFYHAIINDPHSVKIWKLILAALWGITNASILARYLIDKKNKGAFNSFLIFLALMIWWAIHDFKAGLNPLPGTSAVLISILFSKGQIKYLKKNAMNSCLFFKTRQDVYDVFISYKSKDANIVRRVVDVLKANGLKVWFAEWNILLVNYEDFQNEIEEGIERSNSALIFTNQDWFDSEHCNFEMRMIEKKHKRIEMHLYQVRTGNIENVGTKFPLLDNDRLSFEFAGDYNKLFDFIQTCLNTELQLFEADLNEKAITMQNDEITVNMSLYASNAIKQERFYGKEKSLIGAYQLEGLTESSFIETYMFAYYFGKSEVLPENASFNITSNDDRELYNHYRGYAEKWMKQYKYFKLGLHLFHFKNSSHFALTYTYPSGKKNMRVIEKRYVINTNTNPDGQVEELHVFFPVYFDNRYHETEMLEIMHNVSPLFEDMVNTIEIKKLI